MTATATAAATAAAAAVRGRSPLRRHLRSCRRRRETSNGGGASPRPLRRIGMQPPSRLLMRSFGFGFVRDEGWFGVCARRATRVRGAGPHRTRRRGIKSVAVTLVALECARALSSNQGLVVPDNCQRNYGERAHTGAPKSQQVWETRFNGRARSRGNPLNSLARPTSRRPRFPTSRLARPPHLTARAAAPLGRHLGVLLRLDVCMGRSERAKAGARGGEGEGGGGVSKGRQRVRSCACKGLQTPTLP